MKHILLLTILLTGFLAKNANAQILNRQTVAGVLLKNLDKKLPDIINSKSPVENLKIDAMKIRRRHVKVKGNFMVKSGKTQLFTKPLKFKSRLSTNFKNPDIARLRVHVPGDNFLFFRRYRKIF